MERSRAGPSWRAPLGVVVTAIAAVLLVFAVWQTFWLSREAGADVGALSRERVALQFEGLIFPLLLDLQNYRLQVELTHAPTPAQPLQSRIDKEIWRSSAFVRDHDAQLAIQSHWNGIETSWSKARTIRPGYSGPLLDSMEEALRMDVVYRVEDTSGLEYETNRYAQDLGDMLFAKLPSTLDEVGRGNLLTQNAQTQGTIQIPNRIHLASLVAAMNPDGGDFDLNMDDWNAIVKRIPQYNLGTAQQAAQYKTDDTAFARAGDRLAGSEKSNVVVRDRPRGDPAATQALANTANASILRMHADLSQLLDRLLVVRTGYELARNRYVYGIVLLGAALLAGIMLLVAEMTAMRDRNALIKVQRESERLTAQLAREHAERALRLSEAQFRAVFDGAALGIAIVDRSGALIEENAVFRSIYGENVSGVLEEHQREFTDLMRGDRDLFDFEQHVMTPGGHEAWTHSTISLVTDEAGNPYFAIWMFRDLTEFKRNERRIQHDMTHDALTGLPNRGFFDHNIDEQFQQLKSSPESSFAVLFVDLDRFKDINETLGHACGDFVISQAARRLRSAIASADTIARLGSDEFAILLHSLTDVLHVEVIARNVLSALAKPMALGDRSIFLSASVGIALANSAYEHGEDVMRDAEIAMRYAKASGGGRFSIFDSKMHARAEKRLQLTTDLRLALENGEFDLLYQPIVRIADGELTGCEALLRWNHPVEGVMAPAEFMPLAEQTGLAAPIGKFVLRTACRQVARWKRDTADRVPFPINVNVSAMELLDPDFETVLLGAVREFDVDPSALTLEITESAVLDAGSRPNALVERLRAAGFNICIDDFGTGYSSLRYLQQFKVDVIKIDRSFVSGHDGEVASEPIVRTLITLAEAFDVRVVAEGIETQRQREVLRNAGCRYGQGFYYARAISAGELAAMHPQVFGIEPRHASA